MCAIGLCLFVLLCICSLCSLLFDLTFGSLEVCGVFIFWFVVLLSLVGCFRKLLEYVLDCQAYSISFVTASYFWL